MFDAGSVHCWLRPRQYQRRRMALARMNLPGLVLYGGTIAPGKYRGQRT